MSDPTTAEGAIAPDVHPRDTHDAERAGAAAPEDALPEALGVDPDLASRDPDGSLSEAETADDPSELP